VCFVCRSLPRVPCLRVLVVFLVGGLDLHVVGVRTRGSSLHAPGFFWTGAPPVPGVMALGVARLLLCGLRRVFRHFFACAGLGPSGWPPLWWSGLGVLGGGGWGGVAGGVWRWSGGRVGGWVWGRWWSFRGWRLPGRAPPGGGGGRRPPWGALGLLVAIDCGGWWWGCGGRGVPLARGRVGGGLCCRVFGPCGFYRGALLGGGGVLLSWPGGPPRGGGWLGVGGAFLSVWVEHVEQRLP